MNIEKKLEIAKKQNLVLKQEINELTDKIENLQEKLIEPDWDVASLLIKLNEIQSKWKSSLEELEQYKEEYAKLISELKDFRNNMIGSTKLQRWVNNKFK